MDSSVSLEDRIWFLRVCHHNPFSLYPNGMVNLTASNATKIVKDDLLQSGKETIMACFNILSLHLFGNTEENHRTLRSEYPTSGSLTYNASFNF